MKFLKENGLGILICILGLFVVVIFGIQSYKDYYKREFEIESYTYIEASQNAEYSVTKKEIKQGSSSVILVGDVIIPTHEDDEYYVYKEFDDGFRNADKVDRNFYDKVDVGDRLSESHNNRVRIKVIPNTIWTFDEIDKDDVKELEQFKGKKVNKDDVYTIFNKKDK